MHNTDIGSMSPILSSPLSSSKVNIYTTCFNNLQHSILCTEYIYGYHMILGINSDYFLNIINQLIFNDGIMCFLGRNRIFRSYLAELRLQRICRFNSGRQLTNYNKLTIQHQSLSRQNLTKETFLSQLNYPAITALR